MKDRPILFSGPMVRALLEGRKTQTRRVMKPQPRDIGLGLMWGPSERRQMGWAAVAKHAGDPHPHWLAQCPYGVVGDRLWVRERIQRFDKGTCDQHVRYFAGGNTLDRSDFVALAPDLGPDALWPASRPGPSGGAVYSVPSIHMPHWASRLTLTITSIHVERLQAISEADAIAEGCAGVLGPNPDFPDEWDPSPVEEYRDLWTRLHGPDSWAANPWVWVLTFEVSRRNVDAEAA